MSYSKERFLTAVIGAGRIACAGYVASTCAGVLSAACVPSNKNMLCTQHPLLTFSYIVWNEGMERIDSRLLSCIPC